MRLIRFSAISAICVPALFLLGCGSGGRDLGADIRSSNPGEQWGVTDAAANLITEYDLANGCYALQALSNGAFAEVSADGSFRFAAPTATEGESFHLRPAGLGEYLLHDRDGRLMTAQGNAVVATEQRTRDAIWSVAAVDTGVFSLASLVASALTVSAEGQPELQAENTASRALQSFRFVPKVDCKAFPEMPIAIRGETFKGHGVNKPVLGWADTHTHMGMSHEMSADGSVGPSAGGVLYGQIFNPLGVEVALENCEAFHGPNGIRDGNNILSANPTGTHDTVGWPSFVDWPARDELTHQVMYYRWVERAYKAGLRLMVNHGTNIAGLCKVGQLYSLHPDADCDDMSVAVKQVNYLYEMQDYVDAQEGGPGKGWYRIVKSPQEAREVINDGKLAVVLGVEVAQVFSCGVTMLPGGIEVRKCDEAQIDAEIQRLWDMGVRHVYPFHDINSSLGGTGIFSGDVINLLNFLDTGAFWETTECRDYPSDEPSVREPGAEMTTALPGSGNDPLTSAVFELTGGVLPVYPPGRRCNARTVTDLGDYALRALMANKMVIDIDHAAYHSKDIMLNIAEEQTPPYPMASSHDAHGGLTSDQAVRMLRDGGVIYPYRGNGIKHTEFLQKLKFWRAKAGVEDTILGLGYGADGNGFGGHPGPRGAGHEPVVYPFTLFRGEGWGPQFADFEPMEVDLLTIEQSGKYWHIDEVGMANYGLVADGVEEIRLEGGEEAVTALYNSAEAYIQMWERVFNR